MPESEEDAEKRDKLEAERAKSKNAEVAYVRSGRRRYARSSRASATLPRALHAAARQRPTCLRCTA